MLANLCIQGSEVIFFDEHNLTVFFLLCYLISLINALFQRNSSISALSSLALYSPLINPDPVDPSISFEAGKSLCARWENGPP
jgi:hypothetical protein